MPPKSSAASSALTERDIGVLLAVLKANKTLIELDYDFLAGSLGLKNAASARAAWHGLKKKLDGIAGAGADADAGANADADVGEPKTKKKRKAAAIRTEGGSEENGEGEEAVEAPKPKKKKGGKKTVAVKAEVDGEEG
ncbi:hypothetical protein Q7P37_006994 [Cladosporium fusiforme]